MLAELLTAMVGIGPSRVPIEVQIGEKKFLFESAATR
jgi:hypothetical protein